METEFTPGLSLAGGALIGLATVMLMITRGRVLGATGILAGFMSPDSSSDWRWRAAILAGMVSGPLAIFLATGSMPEISATVPTEALIFGGLVVGIGATFGGGCTSGHGVCGMARFSPRSLVATATFMATTAVTVYVIRHMFGGF